MLGGWRTIVSSVNDRNVVDLLYLTQKDASRGTIVDTLFVPDAHALTTTYDFADCGATCDTDAGWWASDDDIDIFPFANTAANRNNHTENVDADYTNLSSSNDTRQASANPGTGDFIKMWFEMTIAEDPVTIGQINFVYEGFTTSVANFSIYVKDDVTAYQNDVAWWRVGTAESIAASTEETVTRSLAGANFADYINGSGLLTWSVTESVAAVVVSTDYVKLDVITHTVEQEGFRWRKDDGSESTASWLAAQDTNITRSIATTTRLRTILNDTVAGDQATTQYQLEYKEDSDTVWRPVQASSGSVAYSSIGTASANQTVVLQTTAPATIDRGDLLVMSVATKHPTNAPATPVGWTEVAEVSGGLGASGVDTGAVYSTVFVREAEGWEDSVVFSVSVPSGNSSEAVITRYTKGTGKKWDIAATTGTDAVADLSWSVTGAADPGITSGDLLVVSSAVNADTGANTTAYSYASQSVSATSATIGTHTERTETTSTGGNNLELVVSTHVVSAGTATAAPVFTMTASGGTASASAPTGASVILRLRQVDAPIQLSASANIAASGANTTAQLSAPSGGPTFIAGRIQDDENPADTIDINDSQYTEMEWSTIATSQAAVGDVYQFRVTAAGQVLTTYTVTPQWTIGPPAMDQIAYRFFNNNNSTDVGSVLANQDTAATLSNSGDAFRLRALVTMYDTTLAVSGQQFKLQFAAKSGTCDVAFSGETYADVTAATVIAYNNNATPADGDNLTANANDPTVGHTVVNQDYEELNNFTNTVATIAAGQDGKWDFALIDNGAPADTAYCFRIVKSDGSLLETYTVIPELATASAGASLTFIVSHDNFPNLSPGTPAFATTTLSVDYSGGTGWYVTLSGDDQSPTDTVMDLTTDAAVGITDQLEWIPGSATTSPGNAVRISALNSSGDVLAFRVMTASGSVAFRAATWWGSVDAYTDNANTLWAGIASSTVQRRIGNSSVSSGGGPALSTVLYYLDVPITQQTGTYTGGVTYTATANP